MIVAGPINKRNGKRFIVTRHFKNSSNQKPFSLKFEIVFDGRTNKWHHFGWPGQKDSLCREKLYEPLKDCACIRGCKEKWIEKSRERELHFTSQLL